MTLRSSTQRSVYGYRDLLRLLTLMSGDEKHEPSATSTLDVLWVLYDRILRIDPASPRDPDRDRFLLSKGHGPMAFYAVLAAKQFIDTDELSRFGTYASTLGLHPDRMLIPGVEVSSGSLGHGLPIAIGVCLALRARDATAPRVFCLLGDGELDEGSNHEAIAFAGRLRLSSLTAIVIDNSSSSLGWPGGIAPRFAVEGWRTVSVDGRDHDAIEHALQSRGDGPNAVVARVERK
ncbi:MAG: transketolase [Acidobacteria bacterium]|nr:transketolase [Acidobacteriota bacterium]